MVELGQGREEVTEDGCVKQVRGCLTGRRWSFILDPTGNYPVFVELTFVTSS